MTFDPQRSLGLNPDGTAVTGQREQIVRYINLKLKALLRKGLKVPFTCSEDCGVSFRLETAGRKPVVVATATRGIVPAAGTVQLKLTATGRKRLRTARSAKLVLVSTAIDAAGNASSPVKRPLKAAR